ncbi:MAG: NAD-dependent protein deacetylase [Gammaproteobacteria bacterium]|nr:NAD-dependent protein deacetylase [Gammaproteobacteria bacterium]
MSPLAPLLEWVDGGRRVVVISGAGCSTASGIGDYRDAAGGWKRPPPMQMQDFVASESARRRYWARSMLGWPVMARARPNAAHQALAELEQAGIVAGLITQNVDGLHQQAGHRDVLELHGSLATVVCLDCGTRSSRRRLQERLEQDNAFLREVSAAAAPDGDADLAGSVDLSAFAVPVCLACGGRLKPDVVFYGDSVPRPRVAQAYALIESADAVLIVGSSLMVFSSFRFCRRARELGIPLAAVNQGVTRADAWLNVKVEVDCAAALPALAGALIPAAAQGAGA